MQPPKLSPHLQALLTHTLSPLPLKHLKSSVCAVRVNSFCTFLPDSSTLEISTSNFLANETSSMPQPRPGWSSSCLLEYWHEDRESLIWAIKVTTTFSWSKSNLGDLDKLVINGLKWSGQRGNQNGPADEKLPAVRARLLHRPSSLWGRSSRTFPSGKAAV